MFNRLVTPSLDFTYPYFIQILVTFYWFVSMYSMWFNIASNKLESSCLLFCTEDYLLQIQYYFNIDIV